MEKLRLGTPYLLKKASTKIEAMDIEQSSEASAEDK